MKIKCRSINLVTENCFDNCITCVIIPGLCSISLYMYTQCHDFFCLFLQVWKKATSVTLQNVFHKEVVEIFNAFLHSTVDVLLILIKNRHKYISTQWIKCQRFRQILVAAFFYDINRRQVRWRPVNVELNLHVVANYGTFNNLYFVLFELTFLNESFGTLFCTSTHM